MNMIEYNIRFDEHCGIDVRTAYRIVTPGLWSSHLHFSSRRGIDVKTAYYSMTLALCFPTPTVQQHIPHLPPLNSHCSETRHRRPAPYTHYPASAGFARVAFLGEIRGWGPGVGGGRVTGKGRKRSWRVPVQGRDLRTVWGRRSKGDEFAGGRLRYVCPAFLPWAVLSSTLLLDLFPRAFLVSSTGTREYLGIARTKLFQRGPHGASSCRFVSFHGKSARY